MDALVGFKNLYTKPVGLRSTHFARNGLDRHNNNLPFHRGVMRTTVAPKTVNECSLVLIADSSI